MCSTCLFLRSGICHLECPSVINLVNFTLGHHDSQDTRPIYAPFKALLLIRQARSQQHKSVPFLNRQHYATCVHCDLPTAWLVESDDAKCLWCGEEPERSCRVLGCLIPVVLGRIRVIRKRRMPKRSSRRTVAYTQSPAYLSHLPAARRLSAIGAMMSPSAVGPTSSKLRLTDKSKRMSKAVISLTSFRSC